MEFKSIGLATIKFRLETPKSELQNSNNYQVSNSNCYILIFFIS